MAIRFVNIILAVLIFFSSTGFTVNSHYCQNELKGINVFTHPESCHSKQTKPACHKDSKPACHQETACKKGCCTNTSDYVKLDQDQQFNGFEFKSFMDPVFITALWIAFTTDLKSVSSKSIAYLNYKPPLIFSDFRAILQTFLL